jgi:hypothetical protein
MYMDINMYIYINKYMCINVFKYTYIYIYINIHVFYTQINTYINTANLRAEMKKIAIEAETARLLAVEVERASTSGKETAAKGKKAVVSYICVFLYIHGIYVYEYIYTYLYKKDLFLNQPLSFKWLVCIHTCVYVHMYKYICIYTYVYINIFPCIFIFIHIDLN